MYGIQQWYTCYLTPWFTVMQEGLIVPLVINKYSTSLGSEGRTQSGIVAGS
jgi:hypothetical protein